MGYVGEVGRTDALNLLEHAYALLNPIRWSEPFGLVMVEALAAGTPVLAFPNGAAPEIVEHGVTGFLCVDEEAMLAQVAEVTLLDRAACRESILTRFSTNRVVDDHLALYDKVIRAASHGRSQAEEARPRAPHQLITH